MPAKHRNEPSHNRQLYEAVSVGSDRSEAVHFTHLDKVDEDEDAQYVLKSVSLTLSISIDDQLT